MKTCKGCASKLPLSSFPSVSYRRKDGTKNKANYCQKCNYKRKVASGAEQRGKIRRYGIEPEIYEQLREAQNYACAICGLPEINNLHGVLYIDHCHETHRVRGLLCSECNSAIGKLKDNPMLARKAAEYLS